MPDHLYQHPNRFPGNAPGAFYTTGYQDASGQWFGDCLSCNGPETIAPDLLHPLDDSNSDTFFVKQPITAEEIERACRAVEFCCVKALRYAGREPWILRRLHPDYCDHSIDGKN